MEHTWGGRVRDRPDDLGEEWSIGSGRLVGARLTASVGWREVNGHRTLKMFRMLIDQETSSCAAEIDQLCHEWTGWFPPPHRFETSGQSQWDTKRLSAILFDELGVGFSRFPTPVWSGGQETLKRKSERVFTSCLDH